MRSISRLISIAYIAILGFLHAPLSAADSFVLSDIRVEGLQRISAGTVFNYMPVKPGDLINEKSSADTIRELFKTGFFKDVRLDRDGSVLVVLVVERPSIAELNIKGNKAIKDEDLKNGLKDIGLATGHSFDRSVLDKISQELRRQYYNQGKYGVVLKTEVTPLERNRVSVDIEIIEGDTAKIRGINIVGNKTFEDEILLEDFESGVGGWFAFITEEDQYSRQKLAGDLETLRSYYLDRGYINFQIASTQVSITPDKKDIYITINVDEGSIYTISDIKLTGDLVTDAEDYFALIRLQRGEPFSRRKVVDSTDRINERLSSFGHAFANVNHIPEINEDDKSVSVTFFVDPGKKVYVRRINVLGNTSTRDRVVRREMRQLEGSIMSNTNLTLSKERLRRLGFFEDVTIETPAVPGSNDQMDVNVTVKEKPSGAINGGVGYSRTYGVSFSASVTEDNFFGTGKKVSFALNNGKYTKHYQLSYFNPYATVDGISRGFNLNYQKTNYGQLNLADYRTDESTASVNYGVPLSDFNRLDTGFGINLTNLRLNSVPSEEIKDFMDTYGDEYLDFEWHGSWKHDSRDSAIFPTTGIMQKVQLNATIPGSDLEYYKLNYNIRHYIPVYQDFVFSSRLDLGYGDGYGGTDVLPFFQNYFAGGERSVRGFKTNTLGPRDSYDEPLGGNIKTAGAFELFAPAPFKDMKDTLRVSGFFDFGNVFQDSFDANELRYSTGMAVTWLSPMGAMALSYGIPLNDKDGDEIEEFQFTFGQTF